MTPLYLKAAGGLGILLPVLLTSAWLLRQRSD
jgi:hypothetical protein